MKMFPNKRSEQKRNDNNWRSNNGRFSENTNTSLSSQMQSNDSSISSRDNIINFGWGDDTPKIHLSTLKAWSFQTENDLIQKIINRQKYFQERCLETEFKDDAIVWVIKIFSKLCSSSTHQDLLLNMMTNEKFILNLEIFLMKLTIQTLETRTWYSSFWINPNEFYNNMYHVLNHIINTIPRRACNILAKLFKTLNTYLALCEIDTELINEVKANISELIEKLTLHANELEEEDAKQKMQYIKELFDKVYSNDVDRINMSNDFKGSSLSSSSCSSKSKQDEKEKQVDNLRSNEPKKIGNLGFKQISEWSHKDITEVAQEIMNCKKSIEKYIDKEIPGNAMVLLIKIFAKLCASSTLIHKDEDIIKMVLREKFFRNLEIFIMKLPLQIVPVQKWYNYFWNNISEFFINLTNLLDYIVNIVTTKTCPALLELFATLKIYLPMFESEHQIELSTEIKLKITTMNEKLLKSWDTKMNQTKFGANIEDNFVNQLNYNWRSGNNNERLSENTCRSLWLKNSPSTSSNSSQTRYNNLSKSSKGTYADDDTYNFTVSTLINWSLKEGNELAQKIIDKKELFKCYLEMELSTDKIVLIIKMFTKLCSSSISHQDVLLNMMTNEKFILNLEIFIMKLTLQKQTFDNRMIYKNFWINPNEFFNNMYDVLSYVMDTTPTRACIVLPKLLQTLTTCLPRCEIDNDLSNEVQGKIGELIEKLGLHADELEEESTKDKMQYIKKLFDTDYSMQDKEKKSVSDKSDNENNQMGNLNFKQIEEWSHKDIIEVAQEIMNHKQSIEKYIDQEIPGDAMVLLINIFAKLCASSLLIHKHKDIIKMALKGKFLRNIEIFIMILPLQTVRNQQRYAYFWNNIAEFFINLTILLDYVMNTVTTDDCLALLELFETLKIYLPMFESEHNIELSTEIKITITALNERLLKSWNTKKKTSISANIGNSSDDHGL